MTMSKPEEWYRTKKCVNQRRSCAMFIAITPDQSLSRRDFRFYCMERWKEPGATGCPSTPDFRL